MVRAFCHGVMGLLSKIARGSSVVRAFCHGVMGLLSKIGEVAPCKSVLSWCMGLLSKESER